MALSWLLKPSGSKVKSKFIFDITFHHLTSNTDEPPPDYLIIQWYEKSKKRQGTIKPAVVTGKKAVWEQTISIPMSFTKDSSEAEFAKKPLTIKLLSKKGSKYSLCAKAFDIDLTDFIAIDGKETRMFDIAFTSSPMKGNMTLTVKTLWIRDFGKRAKSFNRLSRHSSVSGVSSNIKSQKASSDEDSEDEKHKGEIVVREDELNWSIGENPHPDPERGTQLLVALGGKVNVDDIIFLLQRIPPNKRTKILKSLTKSAVKEANPPREDLKRSASKPIPFDILYSVMNHEDISEAFEQQADILSVEFYLNQLCSLILFYNPEFPKLESYIMNACKRSVNFALRVYWHFNSLAGVKKVVTSDTLKKQADTLRLKVVNAVAEAGFLGNLPKENTKDAVKLFNEELAFIDSLIKIGGEIMKMDPATRLEPVRKMLDNLNHRNPEGVPTLGDNQIFLPLIADKNSHAILSIVAQECVIFGTANRAPYLVYFEVMYAGRGESNKDSHDSSQPHHQHQHHHHHLHLSSILSGLHEKEKDKKHKKHKSKEKGEPDEKDEEMGDEKEKRKEKEKDKAKDKGKDKSKDKAKDKTKEKSKDHVKEHDASEKTNKQQQDKETVEHHLNKEHQHEEEKQVEIKREVSEPEHPKVIVESEAKAKRHLSIPMITVQEHSDKEEDTFSTISTTISTVATHGTEQTQTPWQEEIDSKLPEALGDIEETHRISITSADSVKIKHLKQEELPQPDNDKSHDDTSSSQSHSEAKIHTETELTHSGSSLSPVEFATEHQQNKMRETLQDKYQQDVRPFIIHLCLSCLSIGCYSK
eukprot:TRINITY_DN3522_c0_g2_i2.p1 TRINITY_DN3522_c0_g2~~TRINITY_DN3522_c0_g2_i2.p1  ORF type:complete len:812 (-),score=240.42 TRINITY_DN3522_c0_g2_i2:2045-4480(-)